MYLLNLLILIANSHCLIKDKQMGQVVRQGVVEGGLYKLQVPFCVASRRSLCLQSARNSRVTSVPK